MAQQALELVSLAEVIATGPAGHELVPGFAARLSAPLVGGDVAGEGEVTAVLERTAVLELGSGWRGLARIPEVLVDPATVTWRPQAPARPGRPWSSREPDAPVAQELAAQRAASDERARQSREQAGVADDHQVAGVTPADADQQSVVRRSCGGCGRPLRRNNTSGRCTSCQGTCPSCGGPKAPQAEQCRACRHEATPGPAAGAEAPPATGPSPIVEEVSETDQSSAASSADVEQRDDDARARSCAVCGGELPRHNRKGVCTACQGTCPSCGGPKAIQAERCRACRREEPPGIATEAMKLVEALRDLPECVQELLDQVVTLARYARDLEEELAGYRAAERGVRPW